MAEIKPYYINDIDVSSTSGEAFKGGSTMGANLGTGLFQPNLIPQEKEYDKFDQVGAKGVDYLNLTKEITVGSGNTIFRVNNSGLWLGNSVFDSAPFRVDMNGNLTANDMTANNLVITGNIQSAVFQYDVVSAIGGQLLIANADVLDLDMTALDASTLKTRGNTTFAVSDILIIRTLDPAGTGTIKEEYLRVTDISAAPIYTVARDLAGTFTSNQNPAWIAGTAIVKLGESNLTDTYAGGWLKLIGEGTNAPYYSVIARNGVAYNAYAEIARFGNLNGIGGFSADSYGIYVGNNSTGNYMQYDTTSGELVVNDTVLSNQDVFGDGTDGDVTIASGTTTLTSDMYYNNLTISSGAILETAGYRIFVKGTLTNAGTIRRNGNNGGNGGNGANPTGGGSAGTGATALSNGTIYGSVAGSNGGTGGGTGSQGNAGTDGVDETESIGVNGVRGGHGGGNTLDAYGAAGTITETIQPVRNSVFALLMREFSSDNTVKYIKGSAGSGGGEGGFNYGGGGGGSGTPGGIILLVAKKIVNSGTIQTNGGNGGNGGNALSSSGFGGGGGGGGSGGVLFIIYQKLTNTGTIQSAGGSGGDAGTGDNPGEPPEDGPNGGSGNIIYLRV